MDIREKLREASEFIASIPTDIVDAGYNLANTIYYTATGKTLGKPLHSKVLVNNITTKLVNRKVFSDIPTDDELKNPNTAKHYLLKAIRKNDNELMQITLEHSLKNPKSAEAVLKTAEEDLMSKIYAISIGKASTEDGIIASRELELLSQFTKNPNTAKILPFTIKFREKINDENWLKQHPEYRGIKEVLDKYQTINKTLDKINLLSIATFGAGKIGAKVFKTPLAKATAHLIEMTSATTPLVTGVYRASVNHESLSHAISPIDVMMFGDIVRSGKEIYHTTKDAIITHEIYKKLQDPNFNPTEHILSQVSKKYDLTDKELEEFKLAIMSAEKEEFKKSETFYKSLSKNVGEKYSFILRKALSRKNFEEELLQNDKYVIKAFLEHEPLKKYFKENYTEKDGKIVITDINKVEEDLSKMAKSDPVIANFMKYNRQKRLLGELVKAVEHGNKEITFSIIRPSAIIKEASDTEKNTVNEASAVENKVAEEIPPIEDKVIDLTSQSLKSILDEAEKEFSQNAIISLTYKTKNGDVISRTIKPFYAPSNDEFRILKGKFQVLKDGEWQEIEDEFTIPLSRTHEIETALKEIARERGYSDIKPVKEAVEYIKPATNIFPYKLVRLANRLQQIEEKFLKTNEKVKGKEVEEFRKLVEEAYESGYLPPVIKKKIGNQEIELTTPLDYYLQAKPQEVFKIIKDNIIQHTKDILSRNKETAGIFKEIVYDESGALLKFVENELKEYRDIVSGMTKSDLAKNIEEDLQTSIKGFFETTKESYKDYALQTEKIEAKIKDLSNLAKALASAERVSLRDNIKLTDLIDKSAMRIDAIADTIKKIATTPYPEQRRQGSGFATVFDSYESFKDYASLKYLAPTFQHLKTIPFLHKFVEELEELEKRNPHGLNETQKLVKDFLNLYLHRNMTDFAKAHRILGNLITLLNPSIALGNFVASLQSLHALFPSLDLMKIGEIKSVWNREFKKMLYSEGLYKYNIFNPFYAGIEAILKSHILANLKDNKIFNSVILDYAKNIGINDEKIIESIKAYYSERREELAEDIINHISGLDVGALQNFAIEFGRIGESIMPWYRFIFTPLSVATEIIKRWGNAPEYIQRYGIGKSFGKALAFTTFSAIALGSQAVPFMAPAETIYNVVKTLANTVAVFSGEDEVFTDKNFAELVLKELDYNVLKTGLFDPNERVNFYTSFGSALLQAIAGAEASGWDTNAFIHALRVGLDFLSKIGASGVISPTAGSYVADIPAPALSIVQNIVKKTVFANDEQTKQTQTILALLQSFPITNNLYKEIAGKTLVKGVGEKGKEEIWQPSLPQEILSKEGQGLIGIAHLIGFMLLHADAIFNGNEIQKAVELFRYELATDEEKKKMFSPIKNPEGTDYYKLLNFKDYSVFYKLSPNDIIATLKYIPENQMPKVKERAEQLMIKSLSKIAKEIKQTDYTSNEIEDLKNRYKALQNFLITADYLDWYDKNDNTLNTLMQINKALYSILKEKGIDVDYKDIVRVKRKLESERIGSS